MMEPIILGSQSPRRKELLSSIQLPFEQISPNFDEESVPHDHNPAETALNIARGKAHSLAGEHADRLILTADTIVVSNGNIFGKPRDEIDALRMLTTLCNNWHTVITALVAVYKGREEMIYEETQVQMNPFTLVEMKTYLEKIPYRDKAGSYAIQGAGGLIVKRIDGCFYNVMGLPLNALRTLLARFGIDLWSNL